MSQQGREDTGTVGRFAPSPTGPLHFGSLVAAVGSFLFARARGGFWLLRMEDIDTSRVVHGSAEEILEALQRYGLDWDGEVVWQSHRSELYDEAIAKLRRAGQVFDCACSRAEIRRAASAPSPSDPVDPGGVVYPGTCRNGLPKDREARAIRFRVGDDTTISFDDVVQGTRTEEVDKATGDFVVKRADGLHAYQLAVVVDDGEQGVTQIVRGGDLLESTARQIRLQQALGLPTPTYAHLPLIVDENGEKLGKRLGALPLETLDETTVRATLGRALHVLGVEVRPESPRAMLESALGLFDPKSVPSETVAFQQ